MITDSCRTTTVGSPAMWHPWKALRSMTGVTLHMTSELPAMVRAETDGQSIFMSNELLQRERRSSLTHELEHLTRGDRSCCLPKDESRVRQAAAHKLISLDDLAAALAWTRDVGELAEELWCDEITVRTRLTHLHPAERHYLRRRLAHLEESA